MDDLISHIINYKNFKMKKNICLLVSIILFTTAKSQTIDTTTYSGKMNYLFQNIDQTPITSWLLRDYGINFLNLDNYTGTALFEI